MYVVQSNMHIYVVVVMRVSNENITTVLQSIVLLFDVRSKYWCIHVELLCYYCKNCTTHTTHTQHTHTLDTHAHTHTQIGDFGMSRDLEDNNYYITHGGKIPVKWTAPEVLY